MRVSPPSSGQVEVSVFGPGVGECIVIHLGGGDWIVVDSCIDPLTKAPVALDYLRAIGVDVATQVKLVAVTHWHDDHMRGAATVLEECASAQFSCSSALNSVEFQDLVASGHSPMMAPSGIDEFWHVIQVLRARKSRGRRLSAGPDVWAIAGREVLTTSHARVVALSPSDATFTLALREFGTLLPKKGSPKRRIVAQKPNSICTVLSVEAMGNHVLLGSDLECTSDPATGWAAIISGRHRPANRARVYKVAHHGSVTADDPRIWTDLVEPGAHATLTPFRASGLPTTTDCKRILTRTGAASCSAPVRGPKTKLSDGAARSLAKLVAPDMRPLTGPMGQVRLRLEGGDVVGEEHFGAARPLKDA